MSGYIRDSELSEWHTPDVLSHYRPNATNVNTPGHIMCVDVGSRVLADTADVAEECRMLEWMCANVQGRWHWLYCDRNVHEDPSVGNALLDVRREVWVFIEDHRSAMLSKLTWIGLRSKGHAEY